MTACASCRTDTPGCTYWYSPSTTIPSTGTPLPSAHSTRTRVMVPAVRGASTRSSARAAAASGRSPNSVNRYTAQHTTSPEKPVVNPIRGAVPGSTRA